MFKDKENLNKLILELLIRGVKEMANIRDDVVALTAAVAALDVKVSAIPTTSTGGGSTDLTPVLTAVADVKAQLVPTPAS